MEPTERSAWHVVSPQLMQAISSVSLFSFPLERVELILFTYYES